MHNFFSPRKSIESPHSQRPSRFGRLRLSSENGQVARDHGRLPEAIEFENRIPFTRKTQSPLPKLQDNVNQLILACVLFLLPLILSMTLTGLVYTKLAPLNALPGNANSITDGDFNHTIRSSEYYVDYPATQLVFISSLLSTLALALLPVGMGVFSYAAAASLQDASATGVLSALPSSYQFELCLRMLGGSITELYHYVVYVLRSKRRRIPVTKPLQNTALAFVALLLVAALITVVDALLHTGTATVHYHQTTQYYDADFRPGRVMPAHCWNASKYDNPDLKHTYACNVRPLEGEGKDLPRRFLKDPAEAYKILANISDHTSLRRSTDDRATIITPAITPPGTWFRAESYASHTTCETITERCNIRSASTSNESNWQWTYECTQPKAGVNMSGDLHEVGISKPNDLSIRYFSSASKAQNITILGRPRGAPGGMIWSAATFIVRTLDPKNDTTLDGGRIPYNSNMDVVFQNHGEEDVTFYPHGIMSCNTTLSRVTYTLGEDGIVDDMALELINETISSPFFQGMFDAPNYLELGLRLAGASSNNSVDFASQFARVFDIAVLGMTSQILDDQDAEVMYQTDGTTVAKVPAGEFIALVVLSLILTVLGETLTVMAFVLRRREGIIDIQTKLNVGALVVDKFEDKNLVSDATRSEELYAELRGLPTSRIIVDDGKTSEGKSLRAVWDPESGHRPRSRLLVM